MTTTRVPGSFSLVYLVANTIMNVTTQDEQLAVFANAAAHLEPGGCFVIELIVPQLRPRAGDRPRMGVHARTRPCRHRDLRRHRSNQIAWSHHWITVDGEVRASRRALPVRVACRARLDGEARGLPVRDRWGDWDGSPFTSESAKQVVVFEKLVS